MSGGEPPYKIPDWRIYKIEDAPRLVNIQNALTSHGLKDPWLRNEVWKFNESVWGTRPQRLLMLFRGVKWGFAAAVVTVIVEKLFFSSDHKSH